MNVWEDLEMELERYRSTVCMIRQLLGVYEEECAALINKIALSPSFEDAQESFDALQDIQEKLSITQYKFEFPLGGRLTDFSYNMDRDDLCSRQYWYERFKGGLRWPEE